MPWNKISEARNRDVALGFARWVGKRYASGRKAHFDIPTLAKLIEALISCSQDFHFLRGGLRLVVIGKSFAAYR